MSNINNIIDIFINGVEEGLIVYDGRSSDSYVFKGSRYELIYNIDLNAITIYEYVGNGNKKILTYLSDYNIRKGVTGVNIYNYNNLLEIIFNICMTEHEIEFLRRAVDKYTHSEDYVKAGKLNERLDFILKILSNKDI